MEKAVMTLVILAEPRLTKLSDLVYELTVSDDVAERENVEHAVDELEAAGVVSRRGNSVSAGEAALRLFSLGFCEVRMRRRAG